VMERMCRQDRGLFPKPSQISFSCSCPDGAYMCKHVVAVLYGVGARLDERPELLFRLRAVDENDLVAHLDEALPLSNRPVDGGKILETDDISALFGLDMEQPAVDSTVPTASETGDQSRRKRPGKKKAERKAATPSREAVAVPEADKDIAQPSKAPNASPAKRVFKSRSSRKAANSCEPTKRTPSPTDPEVGSRRIKGAKERKKAPRPAIELTPDGFVKWWT
jgi:uncharacterized Zn finger protein